MIVNRELRQFISHLKRWHLSCRVYVKIKGKWVDVKNDKFKWNHEYRIKVSSSDNSVFETNIYEMNEDKTRFAKIMEFLRKILKK